MRRADAEPGTPGPHKPERVAMFPETPPATPGIRWEKTRVANSKGAYDEANVPYIDFNLTIAGKQKPKKRFATFCRPCTKAIPTKKS